MSAIEVRTKHALAQVSFKSSDPAGVARAIFSTFDVVDKDGDIVIPEAIPEGTTVLGAYGHSTVLSNALPIGIAEIRKDSTKAWADLTFNMELQSARDTWSVIKQLGPLQEYSYTFKVLDSELASMDGKRVQVLKSLDIVEVAPVLKGASIGTYTEPGSVKEQEALAEVAKIRSEFLGGDRKDEARALAMRQFLRFVRGQLPA
jgi:hypothetical protein